MRKRTEKSTSGGVILQGKHYTKRSSSAQKTAALSSGEAAIKASIKCSSCETIRFLQLAEYWWMKLEGEARCTLRRHCGVWEERSRQVVACQSRVTLGATKACNRTTLISQGAEHPAHLMTNALVGALIGK